MKKFLFGLCIISGVQVHAQLSVQHGATFTVGNAARVLVGANVTSNMDLPSGTLVMNGTIPQQLNMNGMTIANLEIDNSNDILLQSGASRISNSLVFVNGKIETKDQDIILLTGADISGADASKYFWTNGPGHVISYVDASSRMFPVGATSQSYTPVTVTNNGTADNFSVRVIQGLLSNGTSGTPVTERSIDRTWFIEEAVAGGSNATISIQWNKDEELPGFNKGGVYLSHYTNSQWDVAARQTIAYTNNKASVSRTGITSFSPFSISSTAGNPAVLQILPNIVKDQLNIQAQGNGPTLFYVTDAIGRRVREQRMTMNGAALFSIDVANLASGMYVLVMDTESGKFEQKFLKK